MQNVARPWWSRRRTSPDGDLLSEVDDILDGWWGEAHHRRNGGSSATSFLSEGEAMAWCDKRLEEDGWVASVPGMLATRLGIPYSPHTRSPAPISVEQGLPGWAWDGSVMHGVSHTGRPHDTHKLFHELAHWLCAEPHLRHLPGFGVYAPEQEEAANMIGEVLRRAGGDSSGPPPTLTDKADPLSVARATELLRRAGIMHRKITVLDVFNVPAGEQQ